jgi:hypothetical protein
MACASNVEYDSILGIGQMETFTIEVDNNW